MDRRDRLDLADQKADQDVDPGALAARRSPSQPSWVKFVAVGIIALVVLATVASALLS